MFCIFKKETCLFEFFVYLVHVTSVSFLGTGTNACYVEQLSEVELWDSDYSEPKQVTTSKFWLVVFNVPSTARSFRDGTHIYCPLRRT